MSREAVLGGGFAALAALEIAAPGSSLRWLAAAAALAYALAQGRILAAARGVTAWSVGVMPVVFLASAAVSGLGLLLIVDGLAGRPPGVQRLGATLLVHALGTDPPARPLGAIVLLAAPFVGQGGWHDDDFELTTETGGRLPPSVPVHVFFGLEDDTVPPSHAELWAAAIPEARLHPLPGRDHQLGNDLGEVARVIRELPASRPGLAR